VIVFVLFIPGIVLIFFSFLLSEKCHYSITKIIACELLSVLPTLYHQIGTTAHRGKLVIIAQNYAKDLKGKMSFLIEQTLILFTPYILTLYSQSDKMYNSITWIVQFHCPTCFEPLILVHFQGLITHCHINWYNCLQEFFTSVYVRCPKLIKSENCFILVKMLKVV
jgi:hypothetical protein